MIYCNIMHKLYICIYYAFVIYSDYNVHIDVDIDIDRYIDRYIYIYIDR